MRPECAIKTARPVSAPGRQDLPAHHSALRWRAAQGPQRGVTMAELLVVVAVVGISAMVLLPNLGESMRLAQLRGSEIQLLSDLRVARMAALASQDPYEVSFAQNAVTIRNQFDGSVERGYENQALSGITSIALNPPGSRIAFEPDGTSPGATITLTGLVGSGGAAPTAQIVVYRSGLSRILP